jgi:hypothetical protein
VANKENLFNETVTKTHRASRKDDKSIINKTSGSNITVKGDGSTGVVSGIYAQYKADKNSGVATEISLQSNTITVQKDIITNDLTINRHKLNSQLYEFTNFKNNCGTIMGDLTMNATVLVKCWEPTLEEFVLIRRPARFPVFGNLLDAYVVDERLDVYVDMSEDIANYKNNLNKLYQLGLDDEQETDQESDTQEGETT